MESRSEYRHQRHGCVADVVDIVMRRVEVCFTMLVVRQETSVREMELPEYR